jgi:hypothetical protein
MLHKDAFWRIYVATNNNGLDGTRHHPNRTHDLRSCSQDHHPSTNSVQKTICCNLTSSAPDDGRMRPKHVELRKLQLITLLHQVGISLYLVMKMHSQTNLKFSYKFPISNLKEIRQVIAAIIRAEWQTEMTKVICTFQNLISNVQRTTAKIYQWNKHWNTVLVYWSLLPSVFNFRDNIMSTA